MSARATATSPAAAPGEQHKPRGPRLTPRASILAFVVFIAAIFAVAPARAFLEQRSDQERLAHQVSQLQRENDDLQQRLDDLSDPAHLERLARECLGLVYPGEIALVPIQRNQAPTPPPCD
jgi:cell division protein FtsL